MNYSQLQLIWDAQSQQTLYAFDRQALEREVMTESKLSRLHLRVFENVCAATHAGLAAIIGVETYLQGEYFQIGSILIMLFAATLILYSSRRAEAQARQLGEGVIGILDKGILRTNRMITLIKSCFIGFCGFLVYGTIVRAIFCDLWVHSEVKLIASIVSPILMFVLLSWEIRKVHGPRLEKLKALRAKLSESEPIRHQE